VKRSHSVCKLWDLPGEIALNIYSYGHQSLASLYVYRMSRQRLKQMSFRLRMFCLMTTFEQVHEYPESDEYNSDIESSDDTA
jgi:hypothetical protein